MSESRYPCAGCGHLVFASLPGSYDLCPVCDWEDDALQLEFATTLAGGANGITLLAWQHRHQLGGFRRAPAPSRTPPRDPLWRPIDPTQDHFEDFAAPVRRRAPEDPEALYYWRPTFWRRAPAT